MKKLYSKKEMEEMNRLNYHCPLRNHRVQIELCAHIQSNKKNWRKCFDLECDKLDSDFVLASIEEDKEPLDSD